MVDQFDQTVLNAQRIGTDGLDGRTGLPLHIIGAVQGKALGLFAQTARNGQHVAVIVQRDHSSLRAHVAVIVDGAIFAGAGLGVPSSLNTCTSSSEWR